MIRLCACLSVGLHVIEPCGFVFDDKRLRRVALDYYDHAIITRHSSWEAFLKARDTKARLILITNQQPTATLPEFTFAPSDLLLMGRESAGFPPDVLAAADERVIIPMKPGVRSLNVASAAAIALGEALRQTGWP